MLIVVCKLTLPDGQLVTGRIEARSSGASYPITYEGAVDRLGLKYEKGTPADLELVFTLAARTTGAALSIEKTGKYEPRTEFIARPRE
jgi:hypothetical protein